MPALSFLGLASGCVRGVIPVLSPAAPVRGSGFLDRHESVHGSSTRTSLFAIVLKTRPPDRSRVISFGERWQTRIGCPASSICGSTEVAKRLPSGSVAFRDDREQGCSRSSLTGWIHGGPRKQPTPAEGAALTARKSPADRVLSYERGKPCRSLSLLRVRPTRHLLTSASLRGRPYASVRA